MLSSISRFFATASSAIPAFDMTPAACTQIKKLLKGDVENKMLRIALKAGGCAGFSYDFSLDSAARKGDKVFQRDGATVVIDEKSLLYLRRSKLDFKTDVFASTFSIILPENSNVHNCHCGHSLGVENGTCIH